MSLRHPISKNFVHQVLHGIFVANDSADGVWVPASQEQVGAHKRRALARGLQGSRDRLKARHASM